MTHVETVHKKELLTLTDKTTDKTYQLLIETKITIIADNLEMRIQ